MDLLFLLRSCENLCFLIVRQWGEGEGRIHIIIQIHHGLVFTFHTQSLIRNKTFALNFKHLKLDTLYF